MCSSKSTSRAAARDARAARRALHALRPIRPLPLRKGFKKVHPVTECSNPQRRKLEEAKRNGSQEHSQNLNVSSNSCRKLKF